MATADKLLYLDDSKILLRDAIRRAGHYLPDAATFRSYPYAMLPDEASLNLDFVRGEYVAHNWRDGTVSRAGLSNIMTTTRASGGGYFDHMGVYQWATNNVPRIDHDPATLSTSTTSATLAAGAVTLDVTVTYTVGSYVRATYDGSNWMAGRVTASTGSSVTLWVDRVAGSGTYSAWTVIRVRGLMVEESRTRLNTVSTGSTLLNPTRSTYVDDGTLYIDGVTPFRKLVEDTSTNSHFSQPAQGALAANTTYTAQYVVKAAGRTKFRLEAVSAASWSLASPIVAYDLTAKTATGVNGATGTITEIGSGVFLVTWTATTGPSGFSSAIYPWLLNNASANNYAGDGTSGIYISGYNITAGSFGTSLIVGEGAQVIRAADQCAITSLTDWLGTDNTIIIEHNAPSGRVLLSSGSTVLATSQGPGKLAIAYTATETRICQSGGSVTTTGALTFDTSLRLLASATAYANAHARVVQSIPRALTSTELQRITA